MNKLKDMNPATAAVVAVGLVGICVLAYLKVPEAAVTGYGMAFIAVAGALGKLFGGDENASK